MYSIHIISLMGHHRFLLWTAGEVVRKLYQNQFHPSRVLVVINVRFNRLPVVTIIQHTSFGMCIIGIGRAFASPSKLFIFQPQIIKCVLMHLRFVLRNAQGAYWHISRAQSAHCILAEIPRAFLRPHQAPAHLSPSLLPWLTYLRSAIWH